MVVLVEPKGKKEATRGQKQIVAENRETIRFYTVMAATGTALYLASGLGLFKDGLTGGLMTLLVFTALLQMACVACMHRMARAAYSDSGQLLDGGIDLNMKNGFSEYLKDFIILSTLIEILGIFSNYFWWLLLAVPSYAFYLLWTNILGPWFFAPAAEEEEISEKKQRKLDRKMRRQQGR